MEIFRHGGEAHVMRPDGVYRTSVLQPMVGYQPQYDVEAVLREFTQGPFLATRVPTAPGTSAAVAGLFGLGQPGPLQRLGLRIRAAFARARARRFMMADAVDAARAMPSQAQGNAFSIGPSFNLPPQAVGNAYGHGQQIAPALAYQMRGVMSIMSNNHGPGYPGAPIDVLLERRFNTYYRAG